MARKKITADLNGGDAVTAMADLVFQLHDADNSDAIIATANYAEIGSVNNNGSDGANIVYTLNPTGGGGGNGQIILDGVEVGAASNVKIRCKDQADNESILSNAYSILTYDPLNLVTNQFFIDLWTDVNSLELPEGIGGSFNRKEQLTLFPSPDSRQGNILKYGPGVDIGTYTDVFIIDEVANAGGDYHTFANSALRTLEFDLRTNEPLILYIYNATNIGGGGGPTTQITMASTGGAVVRKSIDFDLPINLNDIRLRYLTSNATQYWELSNMVLKAR